MLGRNLVSAARDFGYSDSSSFLDWLLANELNKSQVDILVSHLTISETYFWREPQVFNALTGIILPELIESKRNGDKTIRIWSAGCSTGEEPYSLAIALHRTIPDISEWTISILASDINRVALEKAASAVYTPWSFRNCPPWLIQNYFNRLDGSRYELVPEIKEMVTFIKLNLTQINHLAPQRELNDVDILFCRNVLMYFTSDWLEKIVGDFYKCLAPKGWFVVSSCELSSQVFPQFTSVNFPGAVIYSKSDTNCYQSTEFQSFDSPEVVPDFIGKLQEEAAFVSNPFIPKDTAPAVGMVIHDRPVEIVVIPEEGMTSNRQKIADLADNGYLIDALILCDESIAKDKLDSGLYFIRSSILVELEKISEAILALKQAIYLDPGFIMGHFNLGNLLIGQGKTKMAIRYLQNALDLLNACNDDYIAPESEGLASVYLKEIVQANLKSERKK